MLLGVSMPRILLTGFEPFGKNTTNVSQEILERIESEFVITDPWRDFRPERSANSNKVIVEKTLLKVDESGSNVVAKRLENNESWDLIIHMGLCDSCEFIRFELVARNKIDMKIPDNSGRQLTNEFIGESNLTTDDSFVKLLNHPPLENLVLSNDAGTFLCNETYYRTLQSLSKIQSEETVKACFIHFPSEEKITVPKAIMTLKNVISRFFFKPVIDVVGALVINDDKIMLAKRNTNSEMAGLWEFPGGKIEHGESKFDAIIREMDEEFGWNVSPTRIVACIHHEYPDFAINLNIIEVTIKIDDNIQPSSRWTSHDEVGWFDSVDEIEIAGADYDIAMSILSDINAK